MNFTIRERCTERAYRRFFGRRTIWKKFIRTRRAGHPAVFKLKKDLWIQDADGYLKFAGWGVTP